MPQHAQPAERTAGNTSPSSVSDSSDSDVDQCTLFDHKTFLAEQELSTIINRLVRDHGPTGFELRVADDEGDEDLPALDPEQWLPAFEAWIDEKGLQRYREHLKQIMEQEMQVAGSGEEEEAQEEDDEEMGEEVAVDDDDGDLYDAD